MQYWSIVAGKTFRSKLSAEMKNAVLLTFSLALAGCIVVQSVSGTTIPQVAVDPVAIQANVDTCPSDQVRESTRRNISSTILNLLRNVVVPALEVSPQCGVGTGWQRVVYLNMSDPSEQCPPAWREYSSPARSCGRLVTTAPSCPYTVYSTGGKQYSKVCGRAIGYKIGSPDQFRSRGNITSADQNYVDGVSVTHGNPRNHIWTFAAGYRDRFDCPCSTSISPQIQPSFVGNDYFCEPESSSGDPLWDGQTCTTSFCCSFNSPLWLQEVASARQRPHPRQQCQPTG